MSERRAVPSRELRRPGSPCTPSRWRGWLVVLLLQGAMLAQVAEEAALIASAANRNRFGAALALSGDTLAVGVPEGWTTVNDSGQVDVFARSGGTWTLQQTLEPPGLHIDDRVGEALALEGGLLVVGAGRYKDNGFGNPGYFRGAAWVYRDVAGTWALEQKLQPAASVTHDRVGTAVDLSGDVVVLGAPGNDQGGEGAGCAFVYRHDGLSWVLEQQLFAPTPAAGAGFGRAVSVSADTLAVGAPGAPGTAPGAGAVTVFVHAAGVWSVQAQLVASAGSADDGFGWALSLDGDAVAVGVPRADPAGFGNAGAVHVWRREAGLWAEEARLTAADAAPVDNLGMSVSLHGDLLVTGAPQDDDDGGFAGAAYAFRREAGRWLQVAKLRGSTAGMTGRAGTAVSVDGDRAATGGPNERFDVPYVSYGRAWVFSGLLSAQP